MFRKVIDTSGKQGNLYLAGPGIFLMGTIIFDDWLFISCFDIGLIGLLDSKNGRMPIRVSGLAVTPFSSFLPRLLDWLVWYSQGDNSEEWFLTMGSNTAYFCRLYKHESSSTLASFLIRPNIMLIPI